MESASYSVCFIIVSIRRFGALLQLKLGGSVSQMIHCPNVLHNDHKNVLEESRNVSHSESCLLYKTADVLVNPCIRETTSIKIPNLSLQI